MDWKIFDESDSQFIPQYPYIPNAHPMGVPQLPTVNFTDEQLTSNPGWSLVQLSDKTTLAWNRGSTSKRATQSVKQHEFKPSPGNLVDQIRTQPRSPTARSHFRGPHTIHHLMQTRPQTEQPLVQQNLYRKSQPALIQSHIPQQQQQSQVTAAGNQRELVPTLPQSVVDSWEFSSADLTDLINELDDFDPSADHLDSKEKPCSIDQLISSPSIAASIDCPPISRQMPPPPSQQHRHQPQHIVHHLPQPAAIQCPIPQRHQHTHQQAQRADTGKKLEVVLVPLTVGRRPEKKAPAIIHLYDYGDRINDQEDVNPYPVHLDNKKKPFSIDELISLPSIAVPIDCHSLSRQISSRTSQQKQPVMPQQHITTSFRNQSQHTVHHRPTPAAIHSQIPQEELQSQQVSLTFRQRNGKKKYW